MRPVRHAVSARRACVWGAALAAVALAACGGGSPGRRISDPDTTGVDDTSTAHPRVTLDAGTRYQTISGWEATAQAGQDEVPAFAAYRDAVLDKAVTELGINRLRLAVRSGAEHPQDNWQRWRDGQLSTADWRQCKRYEAVNDNADPNVIAPAGFHFSELDFTVEQIVLPVRQRLQARGEQLYLNLNYTAFPNRAPASCGGVTNDHTTAAEYAEFVLATFQHLKQKYNLEPNAVEVILEPDNTTFWRGRQIGEAIAATGARLAAAGFHPDFIGPSNTNMSNAITYFGAMVKVAGVTPYLKELAYHRYGGVSDVNLRKLADSAVKYGLRTSMLEHIGSGADDLHADLEAGRNSAWQQFAIAWNTQAADDGAQYYRVDGSNRVLAGQRTPALRQYFRHVRAGAVRIGAVSEAAQFRPLAFRHPSGRHTVVVKTSAGGPFYVAGLPAGRYGITYATASEPSGSAADVTLGAGKMLKAEIPEAGVITVFAK